MSSLKSLKKEKVHTRAIVMNTYRVDQERILVEGELKDERSVGVITFTGKERGPGTVHHMVVRLLIGTLPVTILDAEAEMHHVPLDACSQATASLKKLIGMPVAYGFSKEVKDRLDGIEGCNHLTSLVLTMGSAAMQGLAAHRGHKPQTQEERALTLEYIKNSCVVWQEESKFFQEASEEVKQKRQT